MLRCAWDTNQMSDDIPFDKAFDLAPGQVEEVMPMPDRWGTAGMPSNRMRVAMSGGLYLGDEQTGDLRCEDIIGRKLG